ncbi:unnamed protein product [Heterobilharzia americana]|nr:unnamed protein product [Heterobilharzia americana]CAH8506157.1 unnamed protein product [Heterobilharzia americana]
MTVNNLECSICLQNFIHPAQLPCGHIFCFLCIKGCAFHRRKCPMCRSRFSSRFFDDPKLINVWDIREKDQLEINQLVDSCERLSLQLQPVSESNSNQPSDYAWFYEGFQGWWQYDERTCNELENAYRKQLPSHELTIAGYIYFIDLKNMTQIRKDRSGRLRRIKRDLVSCEKKGIAGIRLCTIQSSSSSTAPTTSEQTNNQENNTSNTKKPDSLCNSPSGSSCLSPPNAECLQRNSHPQAREVLRASRSHTSHAVESTTVLTYLPDACRSVSSGPRNHSDSSSSSREPRSQHLQKNS